MKKTTAIVLSLLIVTLSFLSLSACSVKPDGEDAASATVTDAQTTEATTAEPETEPDAETFAQIKADYLSTVESYRETYGEWTNSQKYLYKGMAFCDLFDWDKNGVPELFIAYADDNRVNAESSDYISDLAIFTWKKGEVKEILHTNPGHDYMDTGSDSWIAFLQDAQGNLVLRVNHSGDEWREENLRLYRYDGREVTPTKLYAYAEQDDPDSDVPPALTLFEINGTTTEKAEYDKAMLTDNGVLYLNCYGVDYTPLLEYLRGEKDSYAVAFLQNKAFLQTELNDMPDWTKTLTRTYE